MMHRSEELAFPFVNQLCLISVFLNSFKKYSVNKHSLSVANRLQNFFYF